MPSSELLGDENSICSNVLEILLPSQAYPLNKDFFFTIFFTPSKLYVGTFSYFDYKFNVCLL